MFSLWSPKKHLDIIKQKTCTPTAPRSQLLTIVNSRRCTHNFASFPPLYYSRNQGDITRVGGENLVRGFKLCETCLELCIIEKLFACAQLGVHTLEQVTSLQLVQGFCTREGSPDKHLHDTKPLLR